MKVIEVVDYGISSRLVVSASPRPSPEADELLIKVAAAGVNRADIFQRQGNYQAPPGASYILGLEVSGVVEEVGKNVTGFKTGDKVCAVVDGGGYAEYATVPYTQAFHVPSNIDLVDAAALPEAFFTSWHALFEVGKLKSEERILVHGGASGIGSMAIQFARNFGAEVYATSRYEPKCKFIKMFGATPIDVESEDFVIAIKNLTKGKGVNVILDMVGGDYFQKNLSALSVRGRLVQIAFLKGAKMNVDLAPMLMKNLSMKSFRLRHLTKNKKAIICEKIKQNILPFVEKGKIIPVVDKIFDFEYAENAHERMEKNINIGKILLKF